MVCILVNKLWRKWYKYSANSHFSRDSQLATTGLQYQIFTLKKLSVVTSALLCYGYLKMPEVITMNSAWVCPTPAPRTCRRHPRQPPGACNHTLWPVPITPENCSVKCPIILENCLMDRWCSTTWEYLFPVLWAAMGCKGTHQVRWIGKFLWR